MRSKTRNLGDTIARSRLGMPAYRSYEMLAALRHRDRVSDDRLDLPPARLRMRVTGTADANWFRQGGRRDADLVRRTMEEAGVSLESRAGILDFGCGCGRVLRHWRHLAGPAIYGTDPDPDLVRWCQRNLTFATVTRNGPLPPLDPRPSIDFVYAISVFTHLAEEAGLAWRDELRRLLPSGGFLLLTTHGERFVRRLGPAELAAFGSERHLVVRRARWAGSNLCAAYHPRAYVEEVVAEGFEVVSFRSGDDLISQDLYLLKKA